ncbi:hypothetical protein [Pelagibius marinus]|uniref:hypothetical protein n=1 Tax=Pelagibius marinus TaxID=2762760 RepID=UPI001872BE3B|nr:hypothetical protein [Pelagibius marinus]
MPTTSKIAKTSAHALAVALIVLVGPSLSAGAAPVKNGSQYEQLAAQQLKLQPRPSGPVQPTGPLQKTAPAPRGGANASNGCHDGASQTSYEGPCDNHPEYEATGGCESEATGTSYPGNCQNSSEP